MYHEPHQEALGIWRNLLETGLREDGWPWDWTTLGILKRNDPKNDNPTQVIHAQVIAKSTGVWAAEELTQTLGQISLGKNSQIQAMSKIADGALFQPNDILVDLSGSPSALLALERPYLNLAAYVCGIATATHQLVKKVSQACPKNTPRVALTRKTLPYYRAVAIHGVRVGGGFPHRVSLSGGILIKENHIAAAGSIRNAIEGVRASAPHSLKIEIEVRSEKEFEEALAAQADGILLDNFTPEQVQSVINRRAPLKNRPFIEVSGGLNQETIGAYALEGVDILSTGCLTHSVQAADFSLLVHSSTHASIHA